MTQIRKPTRLIEKFGIRIETVNVHRPKTPPDQPIRPHVSHTPKPEIDDAKETERIQQFDEALERRDNVHQSLSYPSLSGEALELLDEINSYKAMRLYTHLASNIDVSTGVTHKQSRNSIKEILKDQRKDMVGG